MDESEAIATAAALLSEHSSPLEPQVSTLSFPLIKIDFSNEATEKIHETIEKMDQKLLKDTIIHSCKCKILQNCEIVHCKSMKFVIGHSIKCKLKAIDGCKVCKHVVSLFDCHSRFCHNNECAEAFCKGMKMKYRAREITAMVQKRVREDNFTARRMQLMEMMYQNNSKIQKKTYMLRKSIGKNEENLKLPKNDELKYESDDRENEKKCEDKKLLG
ncbi:hypothetical protein PVAND_017035 [Polypedilum vanderplanki]|uniref:histone acetyltransferase n=1 Tax=Polypedilum vanderplanki TaxID=319348 RepID=A0A9J6BH20_POLVA|nr:hypothetical protein PVAND_017035 [Polypedilum vanderplanki]